MKYKKIKIIPCIVNCTPVEQVENEEQKRKEDQEGEVSDPRQWGNMQKVNFRQIFLTHA